MARHLHFSGLKPGDTTWYEQGPLRKVTPIFPGDRIPLGEFEWAQHYVNLGLAEYAGDDDGQDPRMNLVEDGLRDVLLKFGVDLPGQADPRLWTLPQMLAHLGKLWQGHEQAVLVYRQELERLDQESRVQHERDLAELESRELEIEARRADPYGHLAEGAPDAGPDAGDGGEAPGPGGAEPGA